MSRPPAGSVDAVATWVHSQLCSSAFDPSTRDSHSWADHSGAGYRVMARDLLAALDSAGLELIRRRSS